jgi:hypothetical protein
MTESVDRIELGLGLDGKRPPRIGFELVVCGDDSLALIAKHEGEAPQTIASIVIDDGLIAFKPNLAIYARKLCAALGIEMGDPLLMSIDAEADLVGELPTDHTAILGGDERELTLAVLDRYAGGQGPFTPHDAARVARLIRGESLPADVVRLVLAARVVSLGDVATAIAAQADGLDDDLYQQIKALDAAAEAFASRVPWDDEPSDEEAAPEPTVHHGTINIDGQDHAIRLEIHQTEGGAFDLDGHEVEDDGFETIDLSGITRAKAVAYVPEAMIFETADLRFDPGNLALINGFRFVPLDRVRSIIELRSQLFGGEPMTTNEKAIVHGISWAITAAFAFCAKCGNKPVIINLDGDDLCGPCANKWALGEAQAEADRQSNLAALEQGDG